MSTLNTLRDITEEPDLGIPLGDGTRLSARIWRPVDADDDPVPVILEYLPYRKRDGTCARDALTHPYFAKRGYACVRVDIRGNGDSEGVMEDEYTAQELSDAIEVIEWLAAQPWCSGTVGMMGISWGGFNGLQVAALGPEPLKAVITLCSTVDRYADDIHYKGGCLLNENLGWGATMWSYSSRAPDPALRDNWRDIWLERLQAEPFLPSVWLRHQTRDEYWKHGSICEDYSAISAKVLAVGGWGDAYKNAVPQIVANLPGAKGIIGPWVHKYPHFAVPEPRIGFLQEALRWWDRWLKGIDTGVEADLPLRLYQMDGVRPATWYKDRPGRWIASTGTHGASQNTCTFALTADHKLEQSSAPPALFSAQIASPAHCGADAGEYCAIWLGPELPGDQRADDALSVTWDSAAFEQPLEITGAPSLDLRLRCLTAHVQLAVRLCHVHPDGSSTRITYGVLNLNRDPLSMQAHDLSLSQDLNVSVQLDHIGYTLPAGHRLRVAVSTAYWPLLWPTPESGRVEALQGALSVPQAQPMAPPCAFLPPASDPPWQAEELRAETHTRRQETDLVTGVVSLVVEDDFGLFRDLEHGLASGSIAREHWSIHPDDVLSARGSCHWSDELIRDDIHLRTETRCEMWSDAKHFYLNAVLEAFEGTELIYSRNVEDKVLRNRL